jgi:hypothetical protein
MLKENPFIGPKIPFARNCISVQQAVCLIAGFSVEYRHLKRPKNGNSESTDGEQLQQHPDHQTLGPG